MSESKNGGTPGFGAKMMFKPDRTLTIAKIQSMNNEQYRQNLRKLIQNENWNSKIDFKRRSEDFETSALLPKNTDATARSYTDNGDQVKIMTKSSNLEEPSYINTSNTPTPIIFQ